MRKQNKNLIVFKALETLRTYELPT